MPGGGCYGGAQCLKRERSSGLGPGARASRIELGRSKVRAAHAAAGESWCSNGNCGSGKREGGCGSTHDPSPTEDLGAPVLCLAGGGTKLLVSCDPASMGAVEGAVSLQLNELAQRFRLAQRDAGGLRKAPRVGDAVPALPAGTGAGPCGLLLDTQHRAAPTVRREPELQVSVAAREDVRRRGLR
jgi:hypothetical protein